MQLVYSGPHPEVVVDELNPEQVIVNGQPVEIPDDLAARLLNQDTWALVGETPAQKAARDKAAADQAQAEADAAKASAELQAANAENAATDTTTKGDS